MHIKAVEASAAWHRETKRRQPLLQTGAQDHNPVGDGLQPLGAVMNGVKRRHHREQNLGGADVAGGLVPADVLLTGLQGQAQGGTPLGVPGLTHQPARHLAAVGITGGEERCMGTATTHGNPKALGTAHSDVCTEISHGLEQHLRQRINSNGDQGSVRVGPFDTGARVPKPAAASGKLQQDAKNILTPTEVRRLGNLQLHTDGLTAGAQHGQGLGQHGGIHQETACALAFAHTKAHRHGLGCGRGLIEQGCVRDRQSRQLADQGLKIQQCFQTPLGDLRLVGGVSGVPRRIFQHLALDQRRRGGAEVTQADQGTAQLIAAGQRSQLSQSRGFIHSCRQIRTGGLSVEDVAWNNRLEKGVKVCIAKGLQHPLHRLGVRSDVAVNE